LKVAQKNMERRPSRRPAWWQALMPTRTQQLGLLLLLGALILFVAWRVV
jgi:hypothetical protein